MPKKSNLVPQYHVYQFGQYKGTLFGTDKRKRKPTILETRKYSMIELDDKIDEFLELGEVGDEIYVQSNNQEDTNKHGVILLDNKKIKYIKWTYLGEEDSDSE